MSFNKMVLRVASSINRTDGEGLKGSAMIDPSRSYYLANQMTTNLWMVL